MAKHIYGQMEDVYYILIICIEANYKMQLHMYTFLPLILKIFLIFIQQIMWENYKLSAVVLFHTYIIQYGSIYIIVKNPGNEF